MRPYYFFITGRIKISDSLEKILFDLTLRLKLIFDPFLTSKILRKSLTPKQFYFEDQRKKNRISIRSIYISKSPKISISEIKTQCNSSHL